MVHLRQSWTRKASIRLNSGNSFDSPWRTNYLPSGDSTNPSNYYLEFEKLGTYLVTYTLQATHFSKTGDCDTDGDDANDAFCGSETSTFHVGPLQDLEVSGTNDASAGQTAYTIRAANNGPEHEVDATVKVVLPDGALVEDHEASEGTYDNGTWRLPALKIRGYRHSQGKPEPVALTLILKDGGGAPQEPAMATISLTDNSYNVCIASDRSTLAHDNEEDCTADTANGGSWHEGTVYDPPANSKAKITAVKGTGGGGAGTQNSPRTQTGTTTTVMWDEVEYLYGLPVAHYEVQWLGSDWTMLADTVIENEFVDAAPTGRRAYRVRAVNEAGVPGPWSGSSVQVAVGSAGAPRNVSARADGNSAIDVSWDSPEDTGGSSITGYRVEWSADREGRWGSGANTTELAYKHRGLQTGATWYYRVAARNRGGLGMWSEPVTEKTASGTPDAPGNLGATPSSDTQIQLTWNEPKDNGQPITDYEIERSRDGSADDPFTTRNNLATDPDTGLPTYTDTGLTANTRYSYRVRAENSVGMGAWSRSVSAMTNLTPPNAPSISSAAADGPNAIIVTWEAAEPIGDLPITQYQVQWAADPDAETWSGPRTLPEFARSWRHTGLEPSETWYYQVRASNDGGWSVWSETGAATTASDGAPKAVSGFRAQYDKDARQVNLTWNDLSSAETTFDYGLERSEDGAGWDEWTTVSSSSCDGGKCVFADTDVWPGARLSYRIRAVADDGEAGQWSGAQSVSVPLDPPDAPRFMWSGADGSNHIYLEWDEPEYDGGSAITGYGLLWCRVPESADEDPCKDAMLESNSPANPRGYSRISLGASQLSYTHSVSPGYYYYYLVRATNGGNNWSEWDRYNFTHAITYAGVPAAPSLTARAVDASQIKLTWNKPYAYGSEISEYWLHVYTKGDNLYDYSNITDILRIPGDQTEYTLGGLPSGTTRYFRILALNDNGEGKFSALRQATTR